ncbi:MAG TPA: Helicase associated domain protein [Acidimicrobiales bacterium]|nr:Helicase associated domain protein [Acidimicrobiales bacterium]
MSLVDVPAAPPQRRLPEELRAEAAALTGLEPETIDEAIAFALGGAPSEDWSVWAACRPDNTAVYFPERGASMKTATSRCATCAVQSECLGTALMFGENFGVWGGTSAKQRRKLRRLLRDSGLAESIGDSRYVSWIEDGADQFLPEPAAPSAPKTPWPHQTAAVSAVADALAAGGRAQVALCTGSGKTHVGIWSADVLAARVVAVLVPNLTLVTQTIDAWAADPAWSDAEFLAVCSDAGGVNGATATTDAAAVAEFCRTGRRVVVSTYHSAQVLVDAAVTFDFVIADEAHHLAGAVDKEFAAVARGEIPAKRILFMTATPKRFPRRSGDVDVIDMDDARFGPRVAHLTLTDAIEAGVIADYRVLVAAVDAASLAAVAARPDMADIDPYLLAGAIAVVRTMGDLDLSSCLSFHTRVERATTFSKLIGPVADALGAARPAGPGWAGWVTGATSIQARQRLVRRLTAGNASWGVLANVGAMGEGVDLPVLDAVAIVDPKNSEVDVLQAAGRALRRGTGGKVGTIILPVVLTGDTEDLDSIDARSLDVVAGVLRALRAHDPALGAKLDRARRNMARQSGRGAGMRAHLRVEAARNMLRSRVELWVPGGATGRLAQALSVQLIRESTASWEDTFGRLQAFVEANGHARPVQSDTDWTVGDDAKMTLGQWVSRQRSLHKRGLLADERVALLSALPGWSWDARSEMWWDVFNALADYVKVHGKMPSQRPPVEWNGHPISAFLNTVRTAYGNGGWITKYPERIAAFQALPGFVWNERDAAWDEHFAQLETFVARNGHASPDGNATVDGFGIGKWVTKQRAKIKNGALEPDRVERLHSLPGWVDDVLDAQWERGFARMVQYHARYGEVPTQKVKCDDGFTLGAWVATQRERWRLGRISQDQIARLEAVAGWEWTPKVGYRPCREYDATRQAQWKVSYERFVAYVAEHGIPTQKTVTADGFRIGAWANKQRTAHAAGRMAQERVDALNAVPGWWWSATATGDPAAA